MKPTIEQFIKIIKNSKVTAFDVLPTTETVGALANEFAFELYASANASKKKRQVKKKK